MAKVLTTDSILQCGHGGTVKTISTAKLKIDGKPVLILGSIGPVVQGCGTPVSSSSKPCTTVTVSGGQAQKLRVGGSPVMLDTVTGTTDGNPMGTLQANAVQTKLSAS